MATDSSRTADFVLFSSEIVHRVNVDRFHRLKRLAQSLRSEVRYGINSRSN
jgi:hypothetical protein